METKSKIFIITVCIFLVLGALIYIRNSSEPTPKTEAEKQQLIPPLEKFSQREKLLKFGMYVTPDPDQNPIDPPERFNGYHTALDIEILPEELNEPVTVYAVCPGKIVSVDVAEGYGGVIIQTCTLNDQEVTILYGHIDPDSYKILQGQDIAAGAPLGNLGADKTPESGGTRKHLHLGIHKGSEIELRGYVQTQAELDDFIDPEPYFFNN